MCRWDLSLLLLQAKKTKNILLKTWGCPEIVEIIGLVKWHLKAQARARREAEQDNTYNQTIKKLHSYLSKMVNKTMVMYRLLSMQQEGPQAQGQDTQVWEETIHHQGGQKRMQQSLEWTTHPWGRKPWQKILTSKNCHGGAKPKKQG